MEKTNWAQKLTSRKLWLAVAGLVVGILLLFGVSQGITEQISGVIMSLGSVIAYIVGEGLVDAASAGTQATTPTTPSSELSVDNVNPTAADGTPTGAAQAAEVKTNTAESSAQA